jgi:hypothetical protein
MWGPHSAGNRLGTQITSLRGCGWYPVGSALGAGNSSAGKEQGRQRSIPQTALPAPDIEIGLRRPVEPIMPRFSAAICDPFHNHRKKSCSARLAHETCCSGIIVLTVFDGSPRPGPINKPYKQALQISPANPLRHRAVLPLARETNCRTTH